jgi:tRNA(adenine34) deaminase
MEFDDLYFMKKALFEAEKALDKNEVPIGAVIVVNQKIIGRGHNLIENLNDVTAHAEMQAITAASNFINGKFLDKCTLYVTLEPCTMCGGALYWTRISRVVIGAMDFKRGYSSLGIKLHPKTKVSNGILADESEKLLQEFFLKKRNYK